jgi:hypothetical protein
VDFPRGSAPRRIDWADVDAKYRRLVPLSGLAPDKVEASLEMVHGFDAVKTVSLLTCCAVDLGFTPRTRRSRRLGGGRS